MWQDLFKNIRENPIFDTINSVASYIFSILKPLLHPYLEELQDFQFTISNPLFWAFFLIAVFFLNCFWKLKKAFVFCFTVAVILLATTGLENSMADVLSKSALFDYMVLRYVSLFVIVCIALYFFFIKLD